MKINYARLLDYFLKNFTLDTVQLLHIKHDILILKPLSNSLYNVEELHLEICSTWQFGKLLGKWTSGQYPFPSLRTVQAYGISVNACNHSQADCRLYNCIHYLKRMLADRQAVYPLKRLVLLGPYSQSDTLAELNDIVPHFEVITYEMAKNRRDIWLPTGWEQSG